MAEHFAYLQGLTARQVVLMAGRTAAPDETPMDIMLLQATSTEKAEGIMRDDPAVSQGVMRARLLPFRVALWSGLASPTG